MECNITIAPIHMMKEIFQTWKSNHLQLLERLMVQDNSFSSIMLKTQRFSLFDAAVLLSQKPNAYLLQPNKHSGDGVFNDRGGLPPLTVAVCGVSGQNNWQ